MSEYKKKCCRRYLHKKTACKKCPVIAPLAKKARKRALRKLRKKFAKSD